MAVKERGRGVRFSGWDGGVRMAGVDGEAIGEEVVVIEVVVMVVAMVVAGA